MLVFDIHDDQGNSRRSLGETSGLQQINLQVPARIAPGLKVEIVLTANDASTQPGVTVAVK